MGSQINDGRVSFRLIALLVLGVGLVFCVICVIFAFISTGTMLGSILPPRAITYIQGGPSMNLAGILTYEVAVWNAKEGRWNCRGGIYFNNPQQVVGVIETGKYYSMGIGPTGMITYLSPIAAPTDLPRPSCQP